MNEATKEAVAGSEEIANSEPSVSNEAGSGTAETPEPAQNAVGQDVVDVTVPESEVVAVAPPLEIALGGGSDVLNKDGVDEQSLSVADNVAVEPLNTINHEELQALCDIGMRHYAAGDFNGAIAQLEQGVVHGDENWKARICLGICYYNTWQLSKAEQIFSYILENSSDTDVRGRVQKALERLSARLYSLQEKSGSFLKPDLPSEQQVIAADAPTPSAESLAQTAELAAVGDAPAALPVEEEEEPVEPPSSPEEKQALCKKGIQAYFADDYQTTIADLRRGLYDDKENWKAHFCLGMSYYNLEKFHRAESVFTQILDHCEDPNIRSRTKQALNTVHQALNPPDEQSVPLVREQTLSGANAAVGEEGRASQTRLRRTAAKPKFEWEFQPVEIEGFEDFTKPSNANPLSFLALIVFAIGFLYWLGLNSLPQIYSSMFVSPYSSHNVSITAYDYLGGMKAATVNIPAAHGTKLSGCFFLNPASSKVVLFCRGTINDSDTCRDLAESIIRGGYSVLVYDPSGSGHSAGPKSWQGIIDDGLFAYDFIQNNSPYKPKDIIVYGRSLGAATAATIAQQRGCGGIILENPFSSLPQLAREKNPLLFIFPNNLCPEPRMDLVKMLSGHDRPLLILQTQDPIVPPADTKALFDEAGTPKDMASGSDAQRSVLKFLGEIRN